MTDFLAESDLNSDAYTPEQVVVGGSDVITKPDTIAMAGVIPALSVMGRVTASGELVVCNSGAVDGSEVPVAILVSEVDTTSAAQTAPVYVAGEFNVDALSWHASFSTDAAKLAAFGDGSPIVPKKLGYSG